MANMLLFRVLSSLFISSCPQIRLFDVPGVFRAVTEAGTANVTSLCSDLGCVTQIHVVKSLAIYMHAAVI